MNFIFVSPNFPKTYYQFCRELKKAGFNVLGIASDSYESLSQDLRDSLTEYYRVDNMEDYNQMYKAVAFFAFKYGKIDFIESNNEYWLEQDAKLRSDFNIRTGKNAEEILFFKSKEAMKLDYKKAKVKTARYIIPTTYEKGVEFINEVGYPVVVKPDNGVGAYNTYKITNDEELKDFYFKNFPKIKYIMEEYVNGDLISFDGVTNGDAEPLFYSNEVFPTPVMDIVNGRLDCYYYCNKECPEDLKDAGIRVLKAFNARYRYFHLEFFRLRESKKGLGKKGDIIGLEVNMRCPGGYTPDMINYSKSVNTYKIFAESCKTNTTTEKLDLQKYYCVYYGRRDGFAYKNSDADVKNTYKANMKMAERLPAILAGDMGDYFYIANFETKEQADEFITYCAL